MYGRSVPAPPLRMRAPAAPPRAPAARRQPDPSQRLCRGLFHEVSKTHSCYLTNAFPQVMLFFPTKASFLSRAVPRDL